MTARILCIEDNPNNMRVVRKYLNMAGYIPLEATDGTSGLAMAASEVPDLILMDINLPDMSGVEVTAKIKAIPKLAHIPIIALTANAMYGDRERFLAEGCDGYVAKPVMYLELVNMISLYLNRRTIEPEEETSNSPLRVTAK